MKKIILFFIFIVSCTTIRDDYSNPANKWAQQPIEPVNHNLNEEPPCSDSEASITRKVDDFTGEIQIATQFVSAIMILKYINKNKSSYYLDMTSESHRLDLDVTSAIILFTDGTKWTKPAKIKVSASSISGYYYSAWINLSQTDLNVFSTKEIKKYRVHFADKDVAPDAAYKFKVSVKCLIDAK